MKFNIISVITTFLLLNNVSASFLYPFSKRNDELKQAISKNDRTKLTGLLKKFSCHMLLDDNATLLDSMLKSGIKGLFSRMNSHVCKGDHEFYLKAIETALRRGDDSMLMYLLSVIQEAYDDPTAYVGDIFERCVMARKYSCIERLRDFKYALKSRDGNNIVHYAVMLNDPKLLKYATTSEYYINSVNAAKKLPMDLVRSREMAELVQKQWEDEFQPENVDSVEGITSMRRMLRKFNMPDCTLPARHKFYVTAMLNMMEEPKVEIEVSRDKALKHTRYFAFEDPKLSRRWFNATLFLKLKFKDEIGSDYSGLTVEWLELLVESMFRENKKGEAAEFTLPLFDVVDEESGFYAPNDNYPGNIEIYQLAGSICALALRHNVGLRVKLSPVIYKLIVNGFWSYDEEDFKAQHPTIYKHTQKLLDPNLDIDSLEMEFPDRGFNAQARLVTKNNVVEYVRAYGKDLLLDRKFKQIQAFVHGFKSITKLGLRGYFSPEELGNVMEGSPVTFTIEDFIKMTKVEGNFEKADLVFKAIDGLSNEDKGQFIKFLTGRQSLPFNGILGLKNMITIQIMDVSKGSDSRMPFAATCGPTLQLIKTYTTSEEIKADLLYAMYNCGDKFEKA